MNNLSTLLFLTSIFILSEFTSLIAQEEILTASRAEGWDMEQMRWDGSDSSQYFYDERQLLIKREGRRFDGVLWTRNSQSLYEYNEDNT